MSDTEKESLPFNPQEGRPTAARARGVSKHLHSIGRDHMAKVLTEKCDEEIVKAIMRGEGFAYCDPAMNNGSITAKKYFDSLREDGYRIDGHYPLTVEWWN